MMQKVGCYVKNEFMLKNSSSKFIGKVKSVLQCAKLCFDSDDCKEGWKFQYGANKCFFYGNLEKLDQKEYLKFKSMSMILPQDHETGWVSGYKSCLPKGK